MAMVTGAPGAPRKKNVPPASVPPPASIRSPGSLLTDVASADALTWAEAVSAEMSGLPLASTPAAVVDTSNDPLAADVAEPPVSPPRLDVHAEAKLAGGWFRSAGWGSLQLDGLRSVNRLAWVSAFACPATKVNCTCAADSTAVSRRTAQRAASAVGRSMTQGPPRRRGRRREMRRL